MRKNKMKDKGQEYNVLNNDRFLYNSKISKNKFPN